MYSRERTWVHLARDDGHLEKGIVAPQPIDRRSLDRNWTRPAFSRPSQRVRLADGVVEHRIQRAVQHARRRILERDGLGMHDRWVEAERMQDQVCGQRRAAA